MSTTQTTTETTTLHLSPQHPAHSLTIQPGRLINTIHETAEWGAKFPWGEDPTETGVTRLALSDEDKKVKDWLIQETKKLGCEVTVDSMGTIFALYPGLEKDAKPTAIGSHLDTQPTGGRYDGILGVLTGLEVLRTLKENNYTPRYPIVLINWMNEEGARWPMALMASSVWAGVYKEEDIYEMESITDDIPKKVGDELERIGYKGEMKASHLNYPIAAHFEIHIEQGPALEREGKKIGIVTGVQGYSWWKVHVKGKAQHTGTTPMDMRSDTLLAVAKMIIRVNEIVAEFGGMGSTGTLDLSPGVMNVIPGEVTFGMDFRHTDDVYMQKQIDEAKSSFQRIAKETGDKITVEFEHIHTQAATHFNETCIQCVRESAFELYGEEATREIVSGAGHDSCCTALHVPTSMIFIPSRDGISHNPEEYSTPEQCHEGFITMLGAVLKYDALREE
ncbi:N-carbamoyl-L-amino acid hydrolase [Cyberlindnera fabianii]|uniref:N-carbamoyl-L-amino acid hydrolase n=1 Tax=Cyberlindnera fabianii TaxID=36022 RepID=A0A1V2L6F9_CYBFA|nr:N-carbamoyl-L-amino acid hydrolase [Cyberlindnera fabianii]